MEKKLCKVINKNTYEVVVANDAQHLIFLKEGFDYKEVEQSCNDRWYLKGHAPAAPEPAYDKLRAKAYPSDREQLDMLYHDIDNGLWGESAKTSSFYLARKTIKGMYPKEDETLKDKQIQSALNPRDFIKEGRHD